MIELNVCLCVDHWPTLFGMNGAGRYAQTLARCMAKRGIEVHVLTPVREPITLLKDRLTRGSPSKLKEQCFAASSGGRTFGEPPSQQGAGMDFQEDGYWVHPRVVKPLRFVSRFQPGIGESWGVWRALEELRKSVPIDVVEFSNWEGIGAVTALCSSLPTVIRVHTTAYESLSLGIGNQRLERGYARLERFAAHHADGLLTHSIAHRNQAAENYGVAPDAFGVVPHGLPAPSAFRKVDRKSRQVLAVGAASPRKGVDFFLEVASRLAHAGVEAEFVWVGRDTCSAPGGLLWKEYARQSYPHLDGIVRFESDITDARLADLYAESTVYFCSARYESFGLTLVEAMQAGTPLLAPNTGAMADITGDGQAGLLYDPQEVESAFSQLMRLLDEPELAQKLGEGGLLRARFEFSASVMTDRVLDYYTALLSRL